MQFTTSGGHVLGFGQSSIIVASLDHMLQVDLVGANLVTPVSQDAAAEAGGTTGAAAAFTQVTYAGLWDGVTAVYDAQDGAILKSTYYVDAYAGKTPSTDPPALQPDVSLTSRATWSSPTTPAR